MEIHELSDGRRDAAVYNESCAFVVTSAGVASRCKAGLEPGSKAWKRALADGHFLPVELAQDDEVVVRVVVGVPLSPAEEAEWIGRIDGVLDVPEGVLVVSGGTGFVEGEEDMEDYVQRFAVPPGRYRVAILSQLPGVNGEADLPAPPRAPKGRKARAESLPAWFRRTRPDAPLPSWLAWREEEDDDDEDDGEGGGGGIPTLEVVSLRGEGASGPGEEKGEDDATDEPVWVDFVIHLEPWRDGMELPAQVVREGFLRPTERRRPDTCPLGLAAVDVERPEPAESPEFTLHEERAELRELFEGARPRPLRGGGAPLGLPLETAWQLLRIPFWCNDAVSVELLATLPAKWAGRDAWLEEAGDLAEAEGREVSLSFAAGGMRRDTLRWMQRKAPLLARLPDGATLTMLTADEDDAEEGKQMWRGRVEAGAWRLEAAWPGVAGEAAADALDLARQAEDAAGVAARDEAEAALLLDRVRDDVILAEAGLRRDGRRVVLPASASEGLAEMLAGHLFQMRHGAAWKMVPIIDEELTGDQDFGAFGLSSPRFQAEMTELLGDTARRRDLRAAKGCREVALPDPLPPGMARVLGGLDAEWAEAGGRPFATIESDAMPGVLVRAYGGEEAGDLALQYVTKFGPAGRDFYSVFEDGSSLTTTATLGFEQSEPKKKIFRVRRAGAKPVELRALHAAGRRAHEASRRTRPRPAARTAEGVAAALVEFLARAAGR